MELAKHYNVQIITQNVDDLHERAGSKNVLHLHGEIVKVRSQAGKQQVYEWRKDLHIGDKCELGSQLRPHIVWFGESVPEFENAIRIVRKADICIVIGTSMVVYPAAGLIHEAPSSAAIHFVNPDVNAVPRMPNLHVMAEKAATGVSNVSESTHSRTMLIATFEKYELQFIRPVLTSRGAMAVKNGYFVTVTSGQTSGVGECSFIEGLSRDDLSMIEHELDRVCSKIQQWESIKEEVYQQFPSIVFAIETALLDFKNGGSKQLFATNFSAGSKQFPLMV